ncbi:MAG: glycosyltransferase family 39 protein [Planctomycetes bacterium]|nr:glycosyltransferase family 39 protein [Planctomycetota bacterium]
MSGRTASIMILLLAVVVRLPDALRSVDGTVLDNVAWRECDTAMMARNFSRGDMNPLRPTVDFGGDGEGRVEAEFPFLPWAMALCYQVLGERPEAGRLLNLLASLAALALFLRLAAGLLPPFGALAAGLFFALSPLPTGLATSLQPDGLMLLGVIGAARFFLRYAEEQRGRDLAWAALFLAAALLAKASAAHLGLFFLLLLLGGGSRALLRSPLLWVVGLLAVLPAVLWYLHGRAVWLEHGNSLGLSSEQHWAGAALFTDPRFVIGVLTNQLRHVFPPAVLLLAAWAALRLRHERCVRVALAWWLSTAVFFLLSARTSGDDWAFYYHAVSTPAAALLFGAAVAALGRRMSAGLPARERGLGAVLAAAAACAGLAVFVAPRLAALFGWPLLLALSGLLAFLAAIWALRGRAAGAGLLLLVLCAPQSLLHLGLKVALARAGPRMSAPYRAAREMAPLLQGGGRIAVAGDRSLDEDGCPVDHRVPYMFYWLERRGFSLPLEQVGVEELRGAARRGARWFVIERWQLRSVPGLEEALAGAFPPLYEGAAARLYRLD